MRARDGAEVDDAREEEQRSWPLCRYDTWAGSAAERRELFRRIAPAGRSGSCWFIGSSGAGKSTLAAALALEFADRTCHPLLVVDTEESMAEAFPDMPVAGSVGEAIELIWQQGTHCRWTPDDPDELERVAAAARELRGAVLLVDESSDYLHSGTKRRSRVLKLIRTHRHSDVWLLFTTQHFSGDVPQAAFGGGPLVYVFNTTGPAALEQLQRRWGVPPELAASLDAGQCFVLRTGISGRIVGG